MKRTTTLLMLSLTSVSAITQANASASPLQRQTSYQCPKIEENSEDHKKLVEIFQNRKRAGGQIITLAGHKFMVKEGDREEPYGKPPIPINFLKLQGKYQDLSCSYNPVDLPYSINLIPEQDIHLFDEKGKLKPTSAELMQKEALSKIKETLKVLMENTQKSFPSLSKSMIQRLIGDATRTL